MRTNTEFILLAIIGAMLVIVVGYTQFVLSAIPDVALMRAYLTSWPSRTIIGLPLLVGVGYVAAAFAGLRMSLSWVSTIGILGGCQCAAVVLLVVAGGSGVLATALCALILVYAILGRVKRNRMEQ